jgi:hypothetical protein
LNPLQKSTQSYGILNAVDISSVPAPPPRHNGITPVFFLVSFFFFYIFQSPAQGLQELTSDFLHNSLQEDVLKV